MNKHRCLTSQLILLFVLFTLLILCIECFNVDIREPIIRTTHLRSTKSKTGYFGFSVALHHELGNPADPYWLLVGAPFDTIVSQENSPEKNKATGAVYKCPLKLLSEECTQLYLETELTETNKNENQLLGFSVYSGTSTRYNQTKAYACAPRRLDNRFMPGTCFAINNNLLRDKYGHNLELIDIRESCKVAVNAETSQKASEIKYLCGFGYSFTPYYNSNNNDRFMLGAPLFDAAKGGIVRGSYSNLNLLRQKLKMIKQSVPDSLGAYSISSGRVFREDASILISVVIGIPNEVVHGNGSVTVTRDVLKDFSQDYPTGVILYGRHFVSGFGHSVLAIDLNGDGNDEVLVGAPFDMSSDGETGAVFVYPNVAAGDNPLGQPIILRPKKGLFRGQFGVSIADIGDINRDGYKDFAIGAPFESNVGAVYIYLGNSKLNFDAPSQHIPAKVISDRLSGFGYSISGSMDIDNTGYPDIAIGSVVSNHSVVLRTIPIRDIFFEEPFTTLKMITNRMTSCRGTYVGEGPCFTISLKFYYKDRQNAQCPPGMQTMHLKFNVTADSAVDGVLNRIAFDAIDGNMYKGSAEVSCGSANHPKEIQVFVTKDDFMDKIDPLKIRVTWVLQTPQRQSSPGQLTDFSKYPIYDLERNFKEFEVPFEHGCSEDLSCFPQLDVQFSSSLKKEGQEYVLFVGHDEHIWVNVTVRNMATGRVPALAHQTFFAMNFSKSFLDFSIAEPGPAKAMGESLTCLVKNPLGPGEMGHCRVKLKVANNLVDSGHAYMYINTSVTVHKSAIVNTRQLVRNMKIRIKMYTDLQLSSTIDPSQVFYDNTTILGASAISQEQKIGSKFTIKYTIKNDLNSSVIPSSRLVILWPYETVGDPKEPHGKYLLYMVTPPKVNSTSPGNKQPHNVSCDAATLKQLVNVLNVRIVKDASRKVQEESVDTPPELGPVKLNPQASVKPTPDASVEIMTPTSATLSCANGTARCLALTCKLGPISRKAGAITLVLSGRIWSHTLKEDYKLEKFVHTIIQATWKPDVKFDIVYKSGTKPDVQDRKIKKLIIQTVLTAANTITLPKVPPKYLGIIIGVSVAGGFIFLIIIIVVLWKLKFFQRKKIPKAGTNQERTPALQKYNYDE